MLEQGVPKLVDHDARRRAVADALLRVVRRDGIHAVSVRTVAAEAGTSPSALRHYFATQDELLAFAMLALLARTGDRVRSLLGNRTGPAGALSVLEEVLPVDDERRDEVQVWLAFVTRSLTEPSLRAIADEAEAAVRSAVEVAVGLAGGAPADVDPTYHLVDGLALHGTLWPHRYPPEHVRAVLVAHLAGLAG